MHIISNVKDKKTIAARFYLYKNYKLDVNEGSKKFPSYFTHLHIGWICYGRLTIVQENGFQCFTFYFISYHVSLKEKLCVILHYILFFHKAWHVKIAFYICCLLGHKIVWQITRTLWEKFVKNNIYFNVVKFESSKRWSGANFLFDINKKSNGNL